MSRPSAELHVLLLVVVAMAYFKIPTIKTKPRKEISTDGLSELSVFFWIEKINNLFQFLEVMDSFEETLFWTVLSPYSTPPGQIFFGPWGLPNFLFQGTWCIGCIAYFRHLIDLLKIPLLFHGCYAVQLLYIYLALKMAQLEDISRALTYLRHQHGNGNV